MAETGNDVMIGPEVELNHPHLSMENSCQKKEIVKKPYQTQMYAKPSIFKVWIVCLLIFKVNQDSLGDVIA